MMFSHKEVQIQEMVIKTLTQTIKILKTVQNMHYLKKKDKILLYN